MALVNCPECRKEISDQVESCPNCGYKMNKNQKEKWYNRKGFLILLIILFWPVGLYGLFKSRIVKKSVKIGICILFGFLIIIGVMVPSSSEDYEQHDSVNMEYSNMIRYALIDWIDPELKSPKTAEFPSMKEFYDHVKMNGNDKDTYFIKSYVDSQNSYGALIRSHYTAIVKYDSGKTQASLLKLQWE